jgi:hypothetical protein
MPGHATRPPTDDWTRPPKSRAMQILIAVLALAVATAAGLGVALLGKTSHQQPAAPAAVVSAPPLPQDACGGGVCQTEQAGAVPAVADGNAVTACEASWKAFSTDRLMTTDILAVEQPARETANAEIKAAGEALLEAYRIAVIAKANGDGDALTKEIELATASAEMNTACFKAGVDIG